MRATKKLLSMLLGPVLMVSGAEGLKNPVATWGADPWVTYRQGFYYYSRTGGNKIWVSKAARLQDVLQQTGTLIWEPPDFQPYSKELWAAELHFVDGHWYVYFAADNGKNANHRMYVLESETDDALVK